MSSCSRSTSVLSYLLGELDGNDKLLFEQHLETCPTCRRELMLERSLQNGLTECTKPDAAPAELRLSVLTRILTVQRPRFPFWQIAVTFLSAAAAFFALLKFLSGSGLLSRGNGLVTGFIDETLAVIENLSTLPLMIGLGIVLIGIATGVASFIPEK